MRRTIDLPRVTLHKPDKTAPKEGELMSLKILKNIDRSVPLDLRALVTYQQGQIVSRTLAQNKSVSLTLFAFDAGEEISSHESKGDAMVQVLDGTAKITVGGEVFHLSAGQTIVMPAGVPHALLAETPFQMFLTVVFPS